MEGKYYTTAEIMAMFGWDSTSTVTRKRESGFLPEPDLLGRPNKWLKYKIDAIIISENITKEDGA
ncbi:hypothetical protein [Psychrobacter sp. I-STPA6b]|uniref:hypothetical protein n=1 Tax=Psychrobacter sp. I-STPA6b TaxID=2585718 RepID=UPI001D0CA877|nr:hypothetical protein [Psychrobacter sp. I-STPA6b]